VGTSFRVRPETGVGGKFSKIVKHKKNGFKAYPYTIGLLDNITMFAFAFML
jgi:hypothetical protein